ncbi:MAG: M14 family zinc carboxypeptidase [Actinomycetota bacterium]
MRVRNVVALFAWVVLISTAAPALPRTTPKGPHDLVRRRSIFGHSVSGHRLHAWEVGDPTEPPVMVVGCIHGNECAALPVARRLIHGKLPRNVDMWVIPTINPDGMRTGTRQNADRVDLNRNFHHLWERIGKPGSTYYSGPHPLSEPESRAAVRFVKRVRPRVSIWFHQAENVVFGPHRGHHHIAHCYSRLVHQPFRREVLTPGSVTTWQNHRFHEDAAILDELPHWGALTSAGVDRYTRSLRALFQWFGDGHKTPCPTKT